MAKKKKEDKRTYTKSEVETLLNLAFGIAKSHGCYLDYYAIDNNVKRLLK